MVGINASVDRYIDSEDALEKIIPGVVLAISNALVPAIFEALATFEQLPSREFLENLNVIRASILRYLGLYVFLFSTLQVAYDKRCQETEIGRSAYATFMVACVFFDVLTSAGLDILWFATGKYIAPAVGSPYFDTVKRVLELVYAQAIIWIGSLFSPILPILGVVRSVALFYVQSWSTLRWCKRKAFFGVERNQDGETVEKVMYRSSSTNTSLDTIIWSLLLAGMAVVFTPVAIGFSTLIPSGIYRSPDWQYSQLNMTVFEVTPLRDCQPEFAVVDGCGRCVVPGEIPTTLVCYQPFPPGGEGGNRSVAVGDEHYYDGVGIYLGALCNACARGCGCGNFDIIMTHHFSRISPLHPTTHAPWCLLDVMPMLIVIGC